MTGEPEITPLDAIVGAIVKRLRIERGLSQEKFAEILGCSDGMVSLLESGKRAWKNKWVWAASQYFGVNAAELFGGTVIDPRDRPVFEAMKQSLNLRDKISEENADNKSKGRGKKA